MARVLILARQGSRSMPGKNLMDFHGRPLLAYPILAAQEAGLTPTVLSDGAETLSTSRELGAAPFALPAELCGEAGTIHASLEFAIDRLGLRDETIVALLGNSPTVSGTIIERALVKRELNAFSGVLTVAPVQDTHPSRLWRLDGDMVSRFTPELSAAAINRQSCHGCVRYDGGPLAFRGDYTAGPTVFPFLGTRVGCVVRDEFGLDVHTPADLAVATYWLWRHKPQWLPESFVAPSYFGSAAQRQIAAHVPR